MILFFRLLRLFLPYKKWMVLGALLSTAATLAGMTLMGLSGWFLASMGLAGVAGASLNYFTPAAAIRGAAIVRTACRYAERLINHDVTLRVVSRLRVWLFTRLLPLAPARTGFLGHSELFSRLRADVDRLEHAYLAVLLPIIIACVSLPLITLFLASYVWQIGALSACAALLSAVVLPYWLSRRSATASFAMVEMEAQLRLLTSDALLGAAELQVYGGAAAQAERIAALTRAHGQRRSQLDLLQALGGGLVSVAAQGTTLCSLLLGGYALQQGRIAPAELAMLVLLAMAQFEVVASLPEAMSQLGATLVSAARVFALIDAQPAVNEPHSSNACMKVASGTPAKTTGDATDIRFTDVYLRYGDTAQWALRGLNLHLPRGGRLAIVGPSGAGKSSLVSALLRFYPIQSGQIELGGRNIEDCSGDAVRALISVVEQRTHIFNGSLLDNLLIARADATKAHIQAALQTAQLEHFVASLPDGLDTWLGESGVRVSGGEARRIAIARALLADRPILILDEPTEGLDAKTAQSLLCALARLMEGRSVLLITHRLEGLAALVDEKITLRDGAVSRID